MSDFLLENINQAIAVQGAVNDPQTDGAAYVNFLANVIAPQIPTLETVMDNEMVGDGFSRVERNIRNFYWARRPFTIAGLLNDHIASILFNAHQGGLVTTTNLTAPAKDISCVQNVINATPKLFSLYRELGGERFIHSDMAPNNYTITQEAEARPTFSCELQGTGHHLDTDEIDATSFDALDISAAPEYEEFHGAATEVYATDGVENYNWTADGELISLSIEAGNNVDVRTRPGDSFKNALNRNSGAFARKIRNGKHSGLIKLKVDLDSSLRTFKSMVAGRKLTGLTIVFNGFNKIAGGALDYEFEVKAPKAGFQMIEGDTDQDFGALSLSILPTRDIITKGRYTNRTRTNKTLT